MPKPDRPERLAQQLRANLKRRKRQARARDALKNNDKSARGEGSNRLAKPSSSKHTPFEED